MEKTSNETAICFVKDGKMLGFYSQVEYGSPFGVRIRCIERHESIIPPGLLVTYLISDIITLNIITRYFLDLKEYGAKTPEDKKSLELFSQSKMQVKILSTK